MRRIPSSVRPHRSRPPTVAEAREIQNQLRGAVICEDDLGPVRWVAGIDVGVHRRLGKVRAAAALLRYPDLTLFGSSVAVAPLEFPYVPGYLSFRELPVAVTALERLTQQPDLLLCDGHGLAHPRRFGLASHLGLETGLPSIGVGKTRLLGNHGPVPTARGEWTALFDEDADGEIIGAVLRTRERVKPIYVSVGHRIGLDTAIAYVMGCVTRYRLPETTRAADRLAGWR